MDLILTFFSMFLINVQVLNIIFKKILTHLKIFNFTETSGRYRQYSSGIQYKLVNAFPSVTSERRRQCLLYILYFGI